MRKGELNRAYTGHCGLSKGAHVSNMLPIVWLQQTRIGLSLFDIQGLGYLKESVSCSVLTGVCACVLAGVALVTNTGQYYWNTYQYRRVSHCMYIAICAQLHSIAKY